MRRFPEYCAAPLLGVLLLTGCATTVPTPRPATTAPRTTTPTTTPIRTTTTSAADGNNVAACVGGNCEVEVGPGAIMLIPQLATPPLTIDTVLVEQIHNGTVLLGVGPVSLDRFHFGCSGGTPPCEALPPTGQANAGAASAAVGAVVTANELTIRVEAVDASSVVIKLSTG